MRTAKAGGQGRVVMDHSFFLGAIRTKCSELASEVSRLQVELVRLQKDEASFTQYETKATAMAKEIKGLQGELADINMMQDKLNTHVDVAELLAEREETKVSNDRAQAEVDAIFAERRKAETQLKLVETELNTERNWAQTLVQQMEPEQQQRYRTLTHTTETLAKDLQVKQRRLDDLNEKIAEMEAELQANPIKREAAALHDQLRQQENKREALKSEVAAAAMESPEKQRERLLAQVKGDNQEMASMERRMVDLETEIRQRHEQEETEAGEMIDEEKRAKYEELLRRDEEIQVFLSTFEDTKRQEMGQMEKASANIVALLEHTARIVARTEALPSKEEHASMKEDLAFKEREMEKSQATAENLDEKRERLKRDLENFDQLETKITKELAQLKAKIQRMHTELGTYRDVDTLTRDAEAHRQRMAMEKQVLLIRRDVVKQTVADVQARLEHARAQLAENETYTQLENLEKKWQYFEKNNFVMRDFIATKEMEADCSAISRKVEGQLRTHNDLLKAAAKS